MRSYPTHLLQCLYPGTNYAVRQNFSWETQHIRLLRLIQTTQVQLREPVSFIGATYRHMGEGLLAGVEMTHR